MVIGANGFIGTHLVKALSSNGWEVDAVYRSEGGTLAPDGTGRVNPRPVRAIDVDLPPLIASTKPDVVLNLAASGVGRSTSPRDLKAGNEGIVSTIMRAVDPTHTTRVLHAGSWSQYGSPNSAAAIDETHPLLPTTAYGEAKLEAEIAGLALAAASGVPFVSLRLFNVYGPGEHPSRLIPHVVDALLKRTRVELTDGLQVRDFVHVSDVAAGFVAWSTKPDVAISSAYNVATGIGTPVRAVVEDATRTVGAPADLLDFGAKEQRIGEPATVIGDASAMTKATGWLPLVTVTAGVSDTVRWIMDDGSTHV